MMYKRVKINYIVIIALIFQVLTSCKKANSNAEIENKINTLADIYIETLLETYPGRNYHFDSFNKKHNYVYNNNLKSLESWHVLEDSIYGALNSIKLNREINESSKVTFWILKEELESNKGLRTCKTELWNVNHITGIHRYLINLVYSQPVSSDQSRQNALQVWSKVPKIIDTEIGNLRRGINLGYSMPKDIVQLVIDDLDKVLSEEDEASSFMSPSERSDNEVFNSQWKQLVVNSIIPALNRYQEYLKEEYLKSTRESVSLLENPNGKECYQAFLRKSTTSKIDGQEVFAKGNKSVQSNMKTVAKIGKKLYGLDDSRSIIDAIKADSTNYFGSKAEVLTYSDKLIQEARLESKNWFEFTSDQKVAIKPYAEGSGNYGSYESAPLDSTAFFRINLDEPKKISKASLEKLVFHETIPGHHFQISTESSILGRHKICDYMDYDGYIEGWARYSEALAEEMNLYKTDASLIIRRAWNYRGMVVDPAIHLKGWSKEKSIDFMMESGGSYNSALSLYYRIIATPGQLTSYDVGATEIFRLRELYKSQKKSDFNIKEFHTAILKNGSIPLTALEELLFE